MKATPNYTPQYAAFRTQYLAAHPQAATKEIRTAFHDTYPGQAVFTRGVSAAASAGTASPSSVGVAYRPPREDAPPPPRMAAAESGLGDVKTSSDKPSVTVKDIWSMFWDLAYRGRAVYFRRQIWTMYGGQVDPDTANLWQLNDEQADALGEATENAWSKYVPKGSIPDQALQSLWPALFLGASLLYVEQEKQDAWQKLHAVIRNGPAVPQEYQRGQEQTRHGSDGPGRGPIPVPAQGENYWADLARGGTGHSAPAEPSVEEGPPSNGGAAPSSLPDDVRASIWGVLEEAGVTVERPPAPGVGLRQHFTRGDLG